MSRQLDMTLPWYEREIVKLSPIPRNVRADPPLNTLTKESRKTMPLRSVQFVDYIEGRREIFPTIPYDEDARSTRKLRRLNLAKGVYPYMTILNERVTDKDVREFYKRFDEQVAEKSRREFDQLYN